MEEKKNQQANVIDLRLVAKTLLANKRAFYKPMTIVFVLSCIYIFSVPRYYSSEASLAPEIDNSMGGGMLSSIASSFGFDLSDMQTTDAITPLLYPDLMDDNGFVASMFSIRVKDQNGEIDTTYFDYLKEFQKKAWWSYPIKWVKDLLPKKEDKRASADVEFDPYYLSKKEDGIAELIRDNIKISVDKKTGVITINTKAQDPLICKTLADSIQDRLQKFIINYRTNKARTDYDYYKQLATNAKQEYEKTRQMYGSMSDASTNVSLKSVELKLEDMENDMQLKFNTYTTMNTQLQAAKAKVQERTPAFTVLKGAAVPVKPAGPKRMLFVFGMLFMTFIATAFYIARKDMHFSF